MSSEPSGTGVRQPDAAEHKDAPQPATQETPGNQAASAPQDPPIVRTAPLPPPSSGNVLFPPPSGPPPSGPSLTLVPPTVVESPVEIEQTRTRSLLGAPRNVSMATLDGTVSDHNGQDPHPGPSQISHSGENGRVHLTNGGPYTNRHPSMNRPQTAPGGPAMRPRTGDSTLRPRTGDSVMRSTIDWVVPVEERSVIRHTVEDRIGPTLEHAIKERDKLKLRAKWAKWSLNIAAGLQVFLGSMTTGLAAIGLSGKNFGVATTVLGILATLTGAFLARVRATDEPESSLIRAHDLDSFIRDCQAFRLDCGLDTSDRFNPKIEEYRRRFEVLLGNLRAEAVKASGATSIQQDKLNLMKQVPQKQLPV